MYTPLGNKFGDVKTFIPIDELFLNNPDIPQELKDELLKIREKFDKEKLEQDKYLEENKHRKIKGYNPDTFMAGYYIWNDKWVIVPMYKNKNEPVLGQIKLVFYNVENGEWLSFIPEEWINFFGKDRQLSVAVPLDIMSKSRLPSVAEQEHPHEMAAYIVQRFFEGKDITKEYEKKLLQQLNLYFPEMGIPYIK